MDATFQAITVNGVFVVRVHRDNVVVTDSCISIEVPHVDDLNRITNQDAFGLAEALLLAGGWDDAATAARQATPQLSR